MSEVEKNQGGTADSAAETPANASKTAITSSVVAWFIRLFKGMLVGVGAILPGLSGGVLAVVFGIYEPLVRFLANIRYKFMANLRFFLPVGIGGLLGVFIFSAVVDYAFTHFAAQFIWLFIGFITGTFPSLYKTSGKEGRNPGHWVLLIVISVGTFFFMHWMETINNVTVQPNFWVWLASGALTGLGLVVPGLSPSNFLIYVGLYQPMAAGIKDLNFGVIIPLVLGLAVCVLSLAKLFSWLFKKYYAGMYHFIIGIVIGSTAAIIPSGVTGWTIAVCAALFAVGAALSYALAKADEAHPHESIFD
jgi:putative membrane protein